MSAPSLLCTQGDAPLLSPSLLPPPSASPSPSLLTSFQTKRCPNPAQTLFKPYSRCAAIQSAPLDPISILLHGHGAPAAPFGGPKVPRCLVCDFGILRSPADDDEGSSTTHVTQNFLNLRGKSANKSNAPPVEIIEGGWTADKGDQNQNQRIEKTWSWWLQGKIWPIWLHAWCKRRGEGG